MQQKLETLTKKLNDSRTVRITCAINALLEEGRITPAEVPPALARAMADETYLTELRLRTRTAASPFGIARCPQ